MNSPGSKLNYALRREQFLENIQSGFRDGSDLLARLERQRMEQGLFLEFNDTSTAEVRTPSAIGSTMLDEASQLRIERLSRLLKQIGPRQSR